MTALLTVDPPRLTAAEFAGRKAKCIAFLKLQGGHGRMYQVEGLTRVQILDQTIKGEASRTWLVDNQTYYTRDQAIAAYNGEPMPAEPVKKFSLTAQIAELEREVAMRAEVYPRQVSSGKMRQSEADYHVDAIKSAIATLRWLDANELTIKQRLAG